MQSVAGCVCVIGKVCVVTPYHPSRSWQLERQDRSSGRMLASDVDEGDEDDDRGGKGKGKGAAAGRLSDQCFVLADIAEPPNMKRAYEASLTIVSLAAQLEASTGVSGLTVRNRRNGSVQVRGWAAAGILMELG